MCSTCNHKLFEEVADSQDKLYEHSFGTGSIYIRYNPKAAKNKYSMISKNDEKGEAVLYRCPTCGRQLF